jgi:L-iditol 2-dehydrogenase
MKVLRLHAPFDLRISEEPVPDIRPDEVLIRIKSVGVCASDLHYYSEGRIGTQIIDKPLIIGHEPSGVIEDVGAAVTSLKKGDRVAVEPAKPCRQCDLCRAGHTHVCKQVQFFGTPPVDGALREFVAWPANLAMPIPDNVSLDEAAMVEPLAIGVHAANISHMKGGETVAVFGAGAIGLSVLQAVKVKGAKKIIVSEPVPERRELALKLGADVAMDTSEDVVDRIIAANDDKQLDLSFECAGQPETFCQAAEVARPLATVVIVGIPSEDEYCFPASSSRRKELTIHIQRRSCGTAEESIQLIERGLVDVKSLVTHVFPLERAREAFELAIAKTDGVIRAAIHLGS